jgi:DNA-binding NtrC family response regulator
VLYVDRGSTTVPFTEDDFAFLQLLSALVARRLEEDERLREAESERRALADRLAVRDADEERDLAWTSPAMRKVRGEAERLLVAFQGRSLPILVSGESGTGKEVLARWLHGRLDGGKGPFVAVNCSAIPHDLAESELFGIEQGVASGVLRRPGRIQQAHGGTLFLDEVGEMSLAVQAKVLRALETRRIVRVGGRDEIPVDVRIVSATNRDLSRAMREGRFREDLYWRLCGVEVRMPPLRERREDVPLLVETFTRRFAEEFGVPAPAFEREALARLAAYPWPGNVRELRQRLGALTAMAAGGTVRVEDLPRELREGAPDPGSPPEAPVPVASVPAAGGPALRSLADVEKEHVLAVLAAVGGDRKRAAEVLGIHRKTLARRLAGDAGDDPA